MIREKTSEEVISDVVKLKRALEQLEELREENKQLKEQLDTLEQEIPF
jgi:cell division protein FtsB